MTSPEPIAGEDGIYLRLERPGSPTHTVKTVVLDPSRLGRQITLDDLAHWVPKYLDHSPRLTQRVGRMPGSRAWAWVPCDGVEVSHHLDEVYADAPGDRAALDRLSSAAAERQLDRSRPLWALTLVHGLEDGRQAVIVRMHHAVTDGRAWLNVLMAVSADIPGVVPTAPTPATLRRVPGSVNRREWVRETLALYGAQRRALRALAGGKRPGLHWRSPLNLGNGPQRVCVSSTVDLADLKRVAKGAGTTVNGAFLGVVAGALRAELLERGYRSDRPLVAAFAVAESADPGRMHGNAVATSFSFLYADKADRIERLRATAASAAEMVALRWATGFAYYRKMADLTQHLIPPAQASIGVRIPLVANQILTSNVAGPTTTRWFGDVELIELRSYSILTAPSLIGLGGYSYRGRMTFGLTVAPGAVPDAEGLLRRVEAELAALVAAVGTDGVTVDVQSELTT